MNDIGFWESAFLWRDPMLAAIAGGALLAYLGVYVVLTRSAFVSAAVSQLAGLGVVVALLLGAVGLAQVPPMAAGIAFGVLGASLFSLPQRSERVSGDAILAAVVIAAAAATLVIARYLTREYQEVQAALFGDAVVAGTEELYMLAGTSVFVLFVHYLFRQRFLLVVFDRDGATAQGMNTGLWATLLGFTIALSISIVTRGLGALPAFGFTVVPAIVGLALSERIRWVFLIAVVVAVLSAALGYYLSFMHDLPTGPTMVAVCVLCLLGAGVAVVARRVSAR